jgi:hypothetical protein
MGNILNKVEERMDAYEEESHREDRGKWRRPVHRMVFCGGNINK